MDGANVTREDEITKTTTTTTTELAGCGATGWDEPTPPPPVVTAQTLLAQQTRTALTPRGPHAAHLLALPPELLLYLLRYLAFADIERLRRTCRSLRSLASPNQIRALLGADTLHALLLGHCRTCLAHDPYRSRLLLSKPGDAGFPLASRCIECAFAARDRRMRAGTKLLMANYESVWVCRWCGRPVVGGPTILQNQFHKPCYRSYNRIVLFYFVVGWIQLGIGITAPALAWRYFRGEMLVFGPTVASFILLFYCLLILICRSSKRVSYQYTVVVEMIIMVLWIPPAYGVVKAPGSSPGQPWPRSTVATLALFSVNL